VVGTGDGTVAFERPIGSVVGVVLDSTEQLTQELYVNVVVANFCCAAGIVETPPLLTRSVPLISRLKLVFPRFEIDVEALVDPVSSATASVP
jgi:hypothetical protein